jgi:surfeit locus 1 family protein
MRLANLEFKPGLLPTLAVFALLPVLIGLGFWQLDRADQKRALLAGLEGANERPPAPLAEVMEGADTPRFRKVRASGRYDREHQILLDNQVNRGVVGYHVLTPLRLAGSQVGILVNRGWVPLGESRSRLPPIPVPEGPVTVSGIINTPPGTGLRLGSGLAQADWPAVVQYVELRPLAVRLGYELLPYVMLLDAEQEHGFARNWTPLLMGPLKRTGPERHVGYAVQWFSLALALVVIYIVVNTKRLHQKEQP